MKLKRLLEEMHQEEYKDKHCIKKPLTSCELITRSFLALPRERRPDEIGDDLKR